MELSQQLKKYRKKTNLTQKELAMKLNVSDKTISSWETGRTYPDISSLINLSSILNISLDEFLKGDAETVDKIDKDLKLKGVYKKWFTIMAFVFIAILGSFIFLLTYQYKNEVVDRFNPLIPTEIGYAAVPTKESAKKSDYNVQKISKNKTKKLLGSPYKNMVVTDNAWGESMYLTFYGGLAPKDKPYAMVKHHGTYVSKINFIDWESIPKPIRNNMYPDYETYREMSQNLPQQAKWEKTVRFTVQTGKY
ncbi:helix-turn-helix domain-containing protein [Companilactobacillus halodurans]|uniref:Helix-turn-helix domain-containing protein n=1 Tax=Companilactobacillus halodurans TaxID=2584183 RepID=A0A5P0ZUH2_9LACO|nr:helix-turn-helix domain-containing protein [Companilactobacillus halodurans]MQS75847.1 helix-turn-helix domain-containing protein [Companilactobacillus halodurans]MQS96661.1 helix-turn-helix domain-containing protein [Companilactobacillus halodurans]